MFLLMEVFWAIVLHLPCSATVHYIQLFIYIYTHTPRKLFCENMNLGECKHQQEDDDDMVGIFTLNIGHLENIVHQL